MSACRPIVLKCMSIAKVGLPLTWCAGCCSVCSPRSRLTGAGQPGRDPRTHRLQREGLRLSTQRFPRPASSHATRRESSFLLSLQGGGE